MIQSSGILKNFNEPLTAGSGYAIIRTRGHWRLFRVRNKGGDHSSDTTAKAEADRALYIVVDLASSGLKFKVLGPTLRASSKSPTPSSLFIGFERYSVSCKSCGWHVDNVRRVGKVKRRHEERCAAADFEVGLYVPLAAVPRAPGYSFSGGKQVSRRKKTASVQKSSSTDQPLNRRDGLSAPDYYPDDN